MRGILARIKRSLLPRGDLGQQFITSGVWAAGGNTLARLLQVVKLVVLAHYLSPSEFGLMGLGMISISVFRRFSNLGLEQALINHRDENIDDYLNTVWLTRIIRGVLLIGVGWVIAPIIGTLFRTPRVVPIIRVLAIGPLLISLSNPGVVYFQKHLEFHKEFFYRMSGTLSNVSLAIAAAIVLNNVWALVIGSLTGRLVRLFVSYIIHNYRPILEFNLSRLWDLVGYSKWITASSPLTFLVSQGDDAFVAWLLGSASLGLYQVSYRLSNAPATEITAVIGKVMFPTYTQLQDDSARFATWYRRMLTITAFVTVPMATGIALVAPFFVRGLFSEQWIPIISLIQILAFYGLVRSIGAVDGSVVRAIGRPDVSTKTHALTLILIAITIYPATVRSGTIGTALAVTGGIFVATAARTVMVLKLVEVSVGEWIISIIYPVLGSLAMATGVIIVLKVIRGHSALLTLVISVVVGIIVYSVAILVLIKITDYKLAIFFHEARNSITNK